MPKYIIERDVPGIGAMSADELRAIAQRSRAVLARLGPAIEWVESYVTQDKLYCVYLARDADLIRAHANEGRFPANRIAEVTTTIDPTIAGG